MNESKKRGPVWVGIDWGGKSHAVAVVSETAEEIERFSVPNSPAGYEQLERRLAHYGELRGIAVESTRHVLLLHLMAQEHPLYLINPKISAAWRDAESLSGAKSDERDGLTLACGLALRHKTLEQVPPEDPAVAHLALLCEKECGFIDQRTALVQQLRSQLNLYYPAALDFFEDWTSPTAWDFLLRFPTADMLCRVREHTLVAFLKGHRIGSSANWKAKVKGRCAASDWPAHAQESCYMMHATGLVKELKVVQATLKQFGGEIKKALKILPQAELLSSLPGAGKKLAPRLTAMVSSSLAQHGGLEALRGHSGVAPVTKQSGKRRQVHIRRMCNKHWRNTLHLFAWCSARASSWAKAFYQLRKAKGDSHSTALRKLADKWLHIIMRMLETGEAYDEQRYLEVLKEKNSPTWHHLKDGVCG